MATGSSVGAMGTSKIHHLIPDQRLWTQIHPITRMMVFNLVLVNSLCIFLTQILNYLVCAYTHRKLFRMGVEKGSSMFLYMHIDLISLWLTSSIIKDEPRLGICWEPIYSLRWCLIIICTIPNIFHVLLICVVWSLVKQYLCHSQNTYGFLGTKIEILTV